MRRKHGLRIENLPASDATLAGGLSSVPRPYPNQGTRDAHSLALLAGHPTTESAYLQRGLSPPRVVVDTPFPVGIRPQLQLESSPPNDFDMIEPTAFQGLSVEFCGLNIAFSWRIVSRTNWESAIRAMHRVDPEGDPVKNGAENFVPGISRAGLMTAARGKNEPCRHLPPHHRLRRGRRVRRRVLSHK